MTPLRLANFVDTPLEALERKGNLGQALFLYNPLGVAEKVVHFTAYPGDRRFAAPFAARGIEIFPFFRRTTRFAAAALTAPAAWFRIVRKIRRERLNIIRGRLPYFSSFLGCVAGRVLGVPSVVSLGGDNRLPQEREGRYYFGSRTVSFGLERTVLRLADAVIVPNAFTAAYVGRIAGARVASRVSIVPWPIHIDDQQKEAASLDHLRLPDLPLVLVVGHLNRYKFAGEMFDVAERLMHQHGDRVVVAFCGDGPMRADGEARLRDHPNVRFLGWQPNAVVLRLMARAAVMLVPMSGFVVLEAASRGVPVIAGDIEWHSEIIRDGDTGWLAPPDAPDAWAARVRWVLEHPDEARATGSRLRALFESSYSPQVALGREIALYRQLLAS
ncbi:MAG TPA: glycosyltransferase [Vicinamibacterales bacterium]|nr:glycosyltransferase [Vicinamibacterales bacterium]